jgi:hypothetical protein
MPDNRPAVSKLKALQFQFSGHIRDPENRPAPEGVEDRRMGIYRDLFYNNIQGFLAGNFPVIRRLYSDELWHQMVRDFFVRHRAHTPLFPELPREFLKFVQECRGPDSGDPPFLLELAHYEWVELAVSLDASEISETKAEPGGDLLQESPVLSPVARLLSYQFPVHRIRPEFRPAKPPAEATYLVVYRNRDDQVKFMSLNPVSARLLSLIEQEPGRSGRAYLRQIADELENAEAGKIVEHGLSTLQDFRDRDILVGTTMPTKSA